MLVLEVLGILAVIGLALVATWMAVIGLLGVVGNQRLRRCRSCGHLLTSTWKQVPSACPVCRHPWLKRHILPVHLRHLFPAEMEPPKLAPGGPARVSGSRDNLSEQPGA